MLVPTVRVVRCAPKTHPCPARGKRGRCKSLLRRRIRSLAYRQAAFLDVRYAEHRALRGCRKSFRSWPLDVPPKAECRPSSGRRCWTASWATASTPDARARP